MTARSKASVLMPLALPSAPMGLCIYWLAWGLCTNVLLLPLPALAQSTNAGDPVRSLPPVEVLGQSPIPGQNQRLDQYPGNAQIADENDIAQAKSGSLVDFFNQRFTGITVNEVQGNPFQIDINYRGHRLSPLLGTAQGLSVYLDGVRMNQPFGDVMNWDLIPETAIAGVALIPGSNPLYGLNTLGGALALTSKSGLTHPGTEVDFSLGSWGRRRLDLGHGQSWGDGWHAYLAATLFRDQGWRERSPGALDNVFLKIGRKKDASEWSLALANARSNLSGNGLLNQSLYDQNPQTGYTFSDATRSLSQQLTFNGSHNIDAYRQVSALAWLRRGRQDNRGGDVNNDWAGFLSDCAALPAAQKCVDPNDADYVSQTAVLNTSTVAQSEAGFGFSHSYRNDTHRLLVGAVVSANKVDYERFEQQAVFDAQRVAVAVPGSSAVQNVVLHGRSTNFGIFVSDLINLGPGTVLSVAGRWNQTRVHNALGQPMPLVRESFSYSKLNPAIGITHKLMEPLTVFTNLSQGTRVPSSLELGCADPAQPCVLPTGLQSDPYLKQIVARTFEWGLRAKPFDGAQISGALFRTDSRDDILFVQSGVAREGYFSNVGRTRRQGAELSARWKRNDWQWRMDYLFLDASYQSSGVLSGPLSTAATPNHFVPGTPIAGLPRHVLKFGVDWRVAPSVDLGADWLVSGSQVVAGNENGDRPTLGKVAAYSVLNLKASWQVGPRWQVYGRIGNLVGTRYASYGAGNLDLFPSGVAVLPGQALVATRFLAPGSPRSLFVGVRYEWDQ